jgi:Tfp pilus assembly protein PilO
MPNTRRKALTRVLQWAALALVAADAVLYLMLVRPLRRSLGAEQQARDLTKAQLLEEALRVESLKKFQAAMPDANREMKIFLRDHVPPRRRCFSTAASLVRRLSQESGLELDAVSYKLDPATDGPLERLGIQVTVVGPFRGLLKFAHGLETGKDFILVRDFTFQPGEGNSLALRLGADLYLEP